MTEELRYEEFYSLILVVLWIVGAQNQINVCERWTIL